MQKTITCIFAFLALSGGVTHAQSQPITHVILFGGEDGDDFQNQFFRDFSAAGHSFSKETKIYLLYGGEKTKQVFVESSWKKANLEKTIGLTKGTGKDATSDELKATLKSISKTIQPGDQVFLIVQTHGSCKVQETPHYWSTSNPSEPGKESSQTDPRNFHAELLEIRQKQGKIAILDGSCYGGESVNYFGDIACVVTESTRYQTACSGEHLTVWRSLKNQKKKKVSISDLYLMLSDPSLYLGDGPCISQPVISGFPDRSDYWYEWLHQVVEERDSQIPDFYYHYANEVKSCSALEAPSHLENWLKATEKISKSPEFIKKNFLNRMKPYLNSVSITERLSSDSHSKWKKFNEQVKKLRPILFEKDYPTSLFDFGDHETNPLTLKDMEKALHFDFSRSSSKDDRPLRKPLPESVSVFYRKIKNGSFPILQEVYHVVIPIYPDATYFSSFQIRTTRVHRNKSKNEKVILSYNALLGDIDDFIKNSYRSEIQDFVRDRDLADQKKMDHASGRGEYNQAARSEAKKILESEGDQIFRQTMAEIQVIEFEQHVKDLKWKEKNKKLLPAEATQLEQIKRCEEFKLDFGN